VTLSLSRHPNGQATAAVADKEFFSARVDYEITHTSLDRDSMPLGALMRWVRTDIQAALSPDHVWETRSKYRRVQAYPIVER